MSWGTTYLKPCPFCGGRAKLYESYSFWVGCLECGARTKSYHGPVNAIGVWNRRA